MTTLDTAVGSAAAITGLASYFMLDGPTYRRGSELGFEGIDFYFGGRAGVLGDVDAEVVSAALVFFNPEVVKRAWDNSRGVMPRAGAAAAFAACGHAWGQAHFPDDLDAARLAALAGRVVDGASPARAPVFAGWRQLSVPDEPKAAALHQMNGLRELRFAYHGAAVVASGLGIADAVWFRSPHIAPMFGWYESPLEGRQESVRTLWEGAEASTNRAMASALGVLDEGEQDEFCALTAEAVAAVSAG